ncbi:hypothetical protein BKA80DRAFT_307159 [Phyllosticta citrichinensis]
MDGDKRRTSALKQTNQKLKQENQDLKDVIREICATRDTASAVEIARRLPADDFQSLEEVAALLQRRQGANESIVGGKTLAEKRAGRSSAERSMDIDAAPQDVNIDSVLETANATNGAQIPFPPPVSSDRAVNLNGRGPAHFAHINTPAWQDAGRSSGSVSVSSPSTPGLPYVTKASHDMLAQQPLSSGGGVFYSNTLDREGLRGQNSWRYFQPENPQRETIQWMSRTEGYPVEEMPVAGLDQVHSASIPEYSLQPPDRAAEDQFTAEVLLFIRRQKDLYAQPIGWLSECDLMETGDAVNSLLLCQMESGIPALSENPSVAEFVASILGQMMYPGIAERVAMFYLMVKYLNWRIFPTMEYYHAIPECLKPTAEQTVVPHPAWVDFLPWPRLRDEFISRPELAGQGNALLTLSQLTRVNWPIEVPLPFDYLTGDWRMPNLGTAMERLPDAFKQHVSNASNWSLDSSVDSFYPNIIFTDKVWIQPPLSARLSDDSMMFDT